MTGKARFVKIVICMLMGMMLIPFSKVEAAIKDAGLNKSKIDNEEGWKFINHLYDSLWFRIGGLLQADDTIFSGDAQDKGSELPNGAEIRRAFVNFGGGVGSDFEYEIDLSFEGAEVEFENAWVLYHGPCKSRFTLGFMTPLSPLENQTANGDIMLLEMSLGSNAFSNTPGSALGLLGQISFIDMFTFSAMVHLAAQDDENDEVSSDMGRPQRAGEELRLTFAPIHTEDRVCHFGLFGRYQSLNQALGGSGEVLQNNLFSTIPEAQARNTTPLVNSGNMRARSFNFLAAEVAGLWGPISLQSEYHHVNVQRVPRIGIDDIHNVQFHAWYVETGYVLTGESREYNFDDGIFGNVKPKNSCIGAWEVVIRLSAIDMIDKNVYGGSEQNVSLGLNWFVNNHVRFVGNYIRANINPTDINNPGTAPAVYHKRWVDIFGIRMQVVF